MIRHPTTNDELSGHLYRPICLMWPERLATSAWLEHLPFAFWIIDAARPRTVVELGTHYGTSYCAFLQAVQHLGLPTRCHAVDTWKGDPQTEFYGEDVYAELRTFHDSRYASFSTLIRSTFDEAARHFADNSIDLLHIDGYHTYETVRHDFETWLPKMSRHGVVLFHDINVRKQDFGVWRLWEEVSAQHPGFNFLHGFGLGVLGVGEDLPTEIRWLTTLEQNLTVFVRCLFENLGRRIRERLEADAVQQRLTLSDERVEQLTRDVAEYKANIARISAEVAARQEVLVGLAAKLAARDGEIGFLKAKVQTTEAARAARDGDIDFLKAKVQATEAALAARDGEIGFLKTKVQTTEAARAALLASTSWRITAPMRMMRRAAAHPVRAAKATRRVAAKSVLLLRRDGLIGALKRTTDLAQQQGVKGVLLAANRGDPAAPQAVPPVTKRRYPSAEQLRLQRLRVLIIGELSVPQCKKYRVDQKRDMIVSLGHDCTVISWREFEKARSLLQTHSVAIFYRVPGFPDALSLMKEAQRLGIPCYFELDDLIFDLDSYSVNPNLASLDTDTVKGLMDGAILYRRALERCRNVIASTPRLAELMQAVGGGLSFTVENALDAETLRVAADARRRPDDGRVRIVYGSGTLTHDADFAFVAPALVRVAMRHPVVDILIIGDLQPPKALLNLGDRILRRAVLPYADYLALLAGGDIAIAPLFPAEFNEAKSNIKFLEAAVVGIPAVCSPRSAFAGAVQHGTTGFLAESEDEWFAALDALVGDAGLRERIGAAARQYVMSAYEPAAIARSQMKPLLEAHMPGRDSRLHIMEVNVLYRPQSFGGATILVESLAPLLHARSDTRVSIFTTAPHGSLAPYALERSDVEGIPIIRVGIQDRPGWAEEWWDEQAGESFREALRALRPDVVHFHAMHGLGAVLLDVCQEEGVRIVVTLHDAWWLCQRQFLVTAEGRYCGQRRINLNVCASCVASPGSTTLRAWRLRRALERADQLLTPSEHWRRFYIDNGFAPDRIKTNENGIRLPAAPKPNARPARLRFGFVAGTEVVKGFPLVKQAFEALQRSDWELVLVNHDLSIGRNSFADIVWRVRGSIRIVPSYSPEQADSFYNSIDVLLFPSQWPEAFGLTVREALARNKWVIATDQGSAAEFIVPGENGTLIPLGQVGPLQAAVEALLNGVPDLRAWVNPYPDRIRRIETQVEELRNIIARVAYQAGTASRSTWESRRSLMPALQNTPYPQTDP